MLPHGAWCLAGNISAPRMQSTIDGLDSFVIHASEPVGNVIDQVVRFCMKPWSLEELIVGYVKLQSFSPLLIILRL